MSLSQQLSHARAFMGIMHGSRAFGAPAMANLFLSNRCNLRCIHCYFYSPYIEKPILSDLKRAMHTSKELPDKEYLRSLQRLEADSELTRNLIHELIGMGTRKFNFSGVGEPFLHKNALEFMDRAKHGGGTCMVDTNGTLLDRTTIDELIRIGFDELKITTLAGSRDMYLRTHPGVKDKAFDDLRDKLTYIAERKAELGVKRPAVSLVFIVIPQNSDGILEFAEFAEFVRADRAEFRPVDTAEDPGLEKSMVLTAEQAASVRKQLIEVKAYLESKGVPNNIGHFFKVFKEKRDTTALYSIIPCYYGWLSVRIDVDGRVYPCCHCFEPLGNINDKKFHEIWNGETYRRFRKEALQINRRKTPVEGCDCNSCSHHTANLRVYKAFHPVKGRSARLRGLTPAGFSDDG